MLFRRFIASGAAIGLLLAAAVPVAAGAPNPAGPRPDNSYLVTELVTGPGSDPDLVNAWGLTRSPTSPWWVANNGTDSTTLYRGDGSKVQSGAVPARVGIPDGAPTGAAFNGVSSDFDGDVFLFDGESGIIFGWQGAFTLTGDAQIRNDDHAGDAVYKGLAVGTADVGDGAQQYLYATDFHNGRIDVFDHTYASQTWAGAFHDPDLPRGYAPFGIANLNGTLFVSYALTQQGSDDERAGQGRGAVDAFATDGSFLGRVATHGGLNAPWGLAWAPADFGRFSNDLIVGNFGDGKLHAFRWNGKDWHPDGTLTDSTDEPIAVDGLWAIQFGGGVNVTNDGEANALYYTAGPDDESAGAFGTITATNP
ncbi:MAG TPA: TIGR03118 family protein [Candidatus Limnocylindrales bacterium]|jgi:uncharacterized protein (TIGR03118 family)|nr:TIGR03118 family protein [Candidatus Limnocylindrales bacterium]